MKFTRFIIIFIFSFGVALIVLNWSIVSTHLSYNAGRVIDSLNNNPKKASKELNSITPGLLPLAQIVYARDGKNINVPIYDDGSRSVLTNEARIIIDKLGINAPIIMDIANDNNAIFDALVNGTVRHPISPKPGEGGISIILGHSSPNPLHNSNYGTVFALLGKLNIKDQFYVEYSDGKRFDYEIQESFIFNPFDPNDVNLYKLENIQYNGIAATTCWPVGTNQKRQAVLAREI